MPISRTLREIALLVAGAVIGDSDTSITGVADIRDAESGDIVFAESPRFLESALHSRAGAVLVNPAMAASAGSHKPLIVVDNPRVAFVQTIEAFAPALAAPAGIDPSARIGVDVRMGADVRIGAQVWIGDRVALGDRVTLLPGVRVGDDCVVGSDTVLHANVVLYPGVEVGVRCILHAGCVIGADGFGYVPVGMALKKVPHIGSVQIGDDVEIGANSCVDRAKTGVTVIGSGTKLDNLVHVAHNVRIGQSCLIIAQAGIAGSVEIGNGVILAGQAGVADHIKIGDGARVGAQGGVIGDVAAGETVSGYPARPHRQKMREHAAAAALPEYIKRIRELEKRLADLEQHLKDR